MPWQRRKRRIETCKAAREKRARQPEIIQLKPAHSIFDDSFRYVPGDSDVGGRDVAPFWLATDDRRGAKETAPVDSSIGGRESLAAVTPLTL
jgi:hypothetical protein